MTTQGPNSGPNNSGPSLVGMIATMWTDVQLAWRLFRDDQVPTALKVIPLLGLAYVVSPIDLVVDVIPVLGQMDDVAVIAFAVKTFIDMAPKDRVAFHRAALAHSSTEGDKTIDGSYRS